MERSGIRGEMEDQDSLFNTLPLWDNLYLHQSVALLQVRSASPKHSYPLTPLGLSVPSHTLISCQLKTYALIPVKNDIFPDLKHLILLTQRCLYILYVELSAYSYSQQRSSSPTLTFSGMCQWHTYDCVGKTRAGECISPTREPWKRHDIDGWRGK